MLAIVVAVMLHAEIINLQSCRNLEEALRTFEGRKLSEQDAAIKLKIEAWINREGCRRKTKTIIIEPV